MYGNICSVANFDDCGLFRVAPKHDLAISNSMKARTTMRFQENNHLQHVTQITCVSCGRDKQAEALSVMTERAEFMSRQPGFVSVCLHRSLDGERIVNMIQWENDELLHAAHQSPEFRRVWDRFDQVTEGIDPHLYEAAYEQGATESCETRPPSVEQASEHRANTIAEETQNVNHVGTHR
jgi:heme-degrading monooxygenase HmoA